MSAFLCLCTRVCACVWCVSASRVCVSTCWSVCACVYARSDVPAPVCSSVSVSTCLCACVHAHFSVCACASLSRHVCIRVPTRVSTSVSVCCVSPRARVSACFSACAQLRCRCVARERARVSGEAPPSRLCRGPPSPPPRPRPPFLSHQVTPSGTASPQPSSTCWPRSRPPGQTTQCAGSCGRWPVPAGRVRPRPLPFPVQIEAGRLRREGPWLLCVPAQAQAAWKGRCGHSRASG